MIRKLKAIFPAMMALKPHTLQESQAHFIERQDMFAPFRAPSKTRSFISILTLFCFLSQSFASILWANPLPEANHRFYREGFVGLHIVPERDGKGHIQGLRVTMSMLEADGNSSPQNAVLQDMPTDSKPKDPSADIKTVVSTVLKIGDNTQEQSLQNLVPQTMQACAQALKDVFFIVDDLGNVSLTSRNIPCDSTDTLSSSGINKNIFIDITEGVTFKNVNKANVCVRAASLKFLGSDNQIQTLDFHKASPASNITSAGDKNHQGMWVDENARLDVKTLRLGSGATFWNDGATTVGQLTGDNASILNDGTLTGFLEGSFDRLQNGSNKEVCTAEYHGTVKGSVTHLHNY
ncbi:MAG: hypothetical protein Q8K36_04870, partial [Alphaproteobacteria bacterium]|nr:hypothetical protein [Alphaproteobacteria bacterium]